MKSTINRQDLIDLGFKEMPHFTIGNILTYDLGRDRQLSISDLGNPNEMLWICQSDTENKNDITKISDVINIRNFDYDGMLNLQDIKILIRTITNKPDNNEIKV